MNSELTARLGEVGLDPASFGDPAEAFAQLHARFGRRATLVDRYELEAAVRGIGPDDLDSEVRGRLALEVIPMQIPGWTVVRSAERTVSDPIEVVPYDDAWVNLFVDWRRSLVDALGVTVRVEHVGSTAVPGLAAKPIVDVQVGVPDVDDEHSYAAAIEHLGVALRSRDPGHRYFRPAGDLPRTVQMHVIEVGSTWEREHLLFRDFLRANEVRRDAYGQLKLELASRYRHDRLAYNEAKTGFVLDALEDAEAWAVRVGWSIDR